MNATPTIKAIADRVNPGEYRLAEARTTESGNLIVEAVFAVPGVMDYPWGPTYVGADVLADAQWLDSLKGVPVTDDDTGAHYDGVTPDTTTRDAIGSVLDAWWDADQSAVIGRMVIDVRRGIDAIRRGVRGVSPAYKTEIVEREGVAPESGRRYTHAQARRTAADNVAVTPKPRGGAPTQLRADAMPDDNATDVNIDALTAKVEALSTAVAALPAAIADALNPEPAEVADADDATDAPKVKALASLFAAADAHGIEVSDDDTAESLRAKVAAKVLGRSVDGLSADALDVAVSLAPKPEADDKGNTSHVRIVSDANRSTRSYVKGS